MSISLSNHDARIIALENKINSIPAGGGVAESHLGNPGYIMFSNGLIVNFGSGNTGGVGFVYVAFKKPFKTKAVSNSYRILKYAYACKRLLFTPLRTMEV